MSVTHFTVISSSGRDVVQDPNAQMKIHMFAVINSLIIYNIVGKLAAVVIRYDGHSVIACVCTHREVARTAGWLEAQCLTLRLLVKHYQIASKQVKT